MALNIRSRQGTAVGLYCCVRAEAHRGRNSLLASYKQGCVCGAPQQR